ncbi:snRNA-activating protein complex subunit 3 [Labeo rohita]|uniref:snRNA-activating protein complex subunit 3 n=1 Tax=Labeo rohita TaxID=84645 RepID=A0ABQ8N1Y9_LABRO|nr:snRNA-activating protein complex subunit 3 [Labeo rohita]
MAKCSTLMSEQKQHENVPVYEFMDVNSKEFHVGTFRDLWLDVLNPEVYSYSDTASEIEDVGFIEEMGIEPKTLEELKSICRDTVDRHEVYANEMEMISVGKKPDNLRDLIPEGEIILTFNIMYPILFQRFKHVRAYQTLQVLGSQKLSDLRDAICCVSDLQVFGEFSNNPDMVPQFISKDHYKSAFFFFNGTFFNDTRFPECQDISTTTQEWARTRDFPEFKTAKMEDTSFYDLKMKVGFPYLYTHQGDCEHVVILTDVRLVHRDDCLDIKLYPLITHKHRVVTRKCSVCHLYISRWITTNDAFAPTEPCLFCDQCFRMFHYDDEGNKLGDFLAYAYVDPGTFN